MYFCVVHLIREKNGIEPFKLFLNSYFKNKSGIEHDILFVFKKNALNSDLKIYKNLVKEIPHKFLVIEDKGFDIDTYFLVAKKTDYKYYVFLNSFSIIHSQNWLLKMYTYISKYNIGLVGASGSMQSICPNINLKEFLYQKKFFKIKNFFKYVFLLFLYPFLFYFYGKFPNPHIRTNAFMISRNDFLKIDFGRFLFKFQTWYFESGRNSLTKQVEKNGKKVVIVGDDFKSYEKKQWEKSNTFWNNDQGNLLISDNQSRKYKYANKELRILFKNSAWGGGVDNFLIK